MAYLHRTFGNVASLPFTLKMNEAEKKTVCTQVDKGINITWTSSCGRLFDAVAALGGGCVRVTYEAQAAIEMEMVCRNTSQFYPYELRPAPESIHWGETGGLPSVRSSTEVGLKPLLSSTVEDVLLKKSLPDIGSKFHRTLARIVAEVSVLISEEAGLKDVALSGGCFQNRLLLKMAVEELRKQGLRPLLHRNAPTNDGGISLGQAAIGHFALN